MPMAYTVGIPTAGATAALGRDGSPGPDLESVKGMTRETLEMRDTDVVLGDVVERLHLPEGNHASWR